VDVRAQCDQKETNNSVANMYGGWLDRNRSEDKELR